MESELTTAGLKYELVIVLAAEGDETVPTTEDILAKLVELAETYPIASISLTEQDNE